MEKLNESRKVFQGTFVDDTTFLGPDGKPYKLIPSVLEDPELSDEDKEKANQLTDPNSMRDNTPFNWEGETDKKKAKLVVDIQTPDPNMTFIDDVTGIAYKWDEGAGQFVQVSGGDN